MLPSFFHSITVKIGDKTRTEKHYDDGNSTYYYQLKGASALPSFFFPILFLTVQLLFVDSLRGSDSGEQAHANPWRGWSQEHEGGGHDLCQGWTYPKRIVQLKRNKKIKIKEKANPRVP